MIILHTCTYIVHMCNNLDHGWYISVTQPCDPTSCPNRLSHTCDSTEVYILVYRRVPRVQVWLCTLEHNTVPVRFGISVFYRPPGSSPDLLDDLCNYFDSTNSAQFAKFVIIGDFNVDMSSCSHPLFQKVNSIMDEYCLSQMVTEFTHTHHNGTKSIIDLLFVNDLHLVRSCCTIPPLSNSDHHGLQIELRLKIYPQEMHCMEILSC